MKKEFREWMEARGFEERTVSTQLSHVARLERHFGDLDTAFDTDGFEGIRASLAYTKEDERNRRPNPAPFPIDGNLYSNLAGYRTTLNYFSDFRRSYEASGPAEEAEENVEASTAAAAKGGSNGSVSWTDERIDRLKELWTQGMTASQIADELGGASRNQVIGKAHRLGLQSRPSPVGPNDKPADGTADVARVGTLFIDAVELEKMRKAFLPRFPDFEKHGFDSSQGGYWDVPRSPPTIGESPPGSGSDWVGAGLGTFAGRARLH